jgi:trk system potassium uptake protein TrkA
VTTQQQHVIIIGSGRLGVELATSIDQQGGVVTIVDSNAKAFHQLSATFKGRTVHGDSLEEAVLHRAGVRDAHAFAAVTSSDSVNIVLARVAQNHYNIPHVVARVYNPKRGPVYEKLNIQTVASSSWGAKRIEEIIMHPGLQSLHSAGNGEVQVYELLVTEQWHNQKLSAVINPNTVPVAIVRGGRALLPTTDFILQAQDLLQVSANSAGVEFLQQHLATPHA